MEFDSENDELNDIEDAKAPNYEQIVANLFDNEKELSVSTYYYLSDLPGEQLEKLKCNWLQIDEQRREMISRSMADIAENNFQVDFSPLAADMLNDPNEKVRLAALDMLWDTDKTNLIQPIIDLMATDAATSVRAPTSRPVAQACRLRQSSEAQGVSKHADTWGVLCSCQCHSILFGQEKGQQCHVVVSFQ